MDQDLSHESTPAAATVHAGARPPWSAPQASFLPLSVTANSGTGPCDTGTIASDVS
ncbi:MAG: hypothetical protein OHK0024_02580 [Thalassobaculales bacterium]